MVTSGYLTDLLTLSKRALTEAAVKRLKPPRAGHRWTFSIRAILGSRCGSHTVAARVLFSSITTAANFAA